MLLFYVLVSSEFKGFGQRSWKYEYESKGINNRVERLMVIHLTKQQLSTISYLTLQWKNKVYFSCIKL